MGRFFPGFVSVVVRAHLALTRRQFLNRCGMGLGALGLGALMQDSLVPRAWGETGYISSLAPRQPHFPAKAKRIIHLYMNGGPSQVAIPC